MRSKALIFLLLIIFSSASYAQEDMDENAMRQSTIEQLIEVIAEGLEEGEELDYTTLFEDLSYYYSHPLNLNKASDTEIQSLFLLTDIQINALKLHILKYGPLDSEYELQAVRGFDLQTIYMILPFIQVDPQALTSRVNLKTILKDGKSDLFIRYQQVLEEQVGYSPISDQDLIDSPNSRYLGSSARLYTRYRFTYKNNLSIGITAEKDPGEEFFTGTQKNGYDFYSGHISYKDRGFVRALALGDFQIQFGQGLALWSGLGFGKSAFALNIKKSNPGIRPYTSVDENRFLRGGAFTLGKGKFELTGFYSSKQIDANIASAVDSLDADAELEITSFQLTGFHRTQSELFDKDALLETHYGGYLSYKASRFRVGAAGLRTEYEASVNRNLSLYNQFDFNSNSNFVGSIDYQALVGNVNFFGEIARSENGGISTLNSALFALHQNLSVVVLHRYYERDFQSVLANAFAESTRPANEQGIYIGMEANLAKKVTLTGYFDRYKFPWLRFITDAPSEGYDALIQLNYKPSRKSEFYVRYRHRERDRNLPNNESSIDYPVELIQEVIRLNASYQVSQSLKFKSRIEFNRFQLSGNEMENGFVIYQDLIYKKLQSPWSLSMRYALFETDSYNARIYAYESDVLYAFSIPAYSGRGARAYAMVKYHIARGVDIWLRWSQWYYTDRDAISSGLEQVPSNQRQEIKAQLRLRF